MTVEYKTELYPAVDAALGFPGAMLSGSKTAPRGCEGHTIFWNACVFAEVSKKDYQQIWHGDLDVTARAGDLQQLANSLGVTIWATPEHPYRFEGFLAGRSGDYRDRAQEFKPE